MSWTRKWLLWIKPNYMQRAMCAALILSCVMISAYTVLICIPMQTGFYTQTLSSPEMLDRNGYLLFARLNADDQWLFQRELAEISPYLVKATIAVEDSHFYAHPGIDPIAVMRAAWQNASALRIKSGASTLAMQVVKLVYQEAELPCNKLLQAAQALRLRSRLSAQEIIQAYLNRAPYGSNLTGCEAAARRYFGKPAKELTLPEAALLAALPKAPTAYSPYLHPAKAKKRRNFVLQRMLEEGMISRDEWQQATDQPLRARYYDFPKHAPHTAALYADEMQNHHRIRTTLDIQIQQMAEQTLKKSIAQYGVEITNGAVIVIDTPSAEVLARVGSVDFFSSSTDGQFDASRAMRSPGSALKPFVYGLAMEQNRLYPDEILLDAPWNRGLYFPENFDQQYRGLVSAKDALNQSLNIPALTVLQRAGIEPFVKWMQQAGVSTLNKKMEEYGLGIILGDCEARLDELAQAYCMIANLGIDRPLQLLMNESESESRRLLSKGTCLALYDMLEQTPPNQLRDDLIPNVHTASKLCWKTGTSQGYRDAWVFMFNQHYVVGVWSGNNDARSSKWLVGAKSAVPLGEKIFRALPIKTIPDMPAAAEEMKEISVCAISGLPVTPWCTAQKTSTIPRYQYLNRICGIHYPAEADSNPVQKPPKERWPLSPYLWNVSHTASPVLSELQTTLHAVTMSQSKPFEIVHPALNAEFILTHETNGDQIQLKTSWDHVNKLYWYLDEQYLGESNPFQPLQLRLTRGKHRLSCMTEQGETAVTQFQVIEHISLLRAIQE